MSSLGGLQVIWLIYRPLLKKLVTAPVPYAADAVRSSPPFHTRTCTTYMSVVHVSSYTHGQHSALLILLSTLPH
jgi:hypothetical protein